MKSSGLRLFRRAPLAVVFAGPGFNRIHSRSMALLRAPRVSSAVTALPERRERRGAWGARGYAPHESIA